MKKGFSKILLTIICSLTMVFCLQVNKIFANSKTYTSEYASYTEEEMKATAKEVESVKNVIEGKSIIKEIVVPKKLVNIVIKGE